MMVTLRSFAPALAFALMACHASGCGHVERPRAEPAVPLGRGLVSVGPSWSCGQLGHGFFECWKPSWSAGPAQSPGSLSWKLARSAEMIAGADRVCVGDPVGNVRCGEDIDLSDTWHFDLAYVAIRTCSAGPLWSCADIYSRSLAGLRKLHDVALGPEFGCGLDDFGRVACAYFGTEDPRSAYVSSFFAGVVDTVERGVVYSMGDFVAESVDVATTHACARNTAGEVRCWGGGQGCHTRSSRTCGEVRIEPKYIGVDLRVDPVDVARGEARRYVIPWETESDPDAEVHLDLEAEHFEQLARGQRIRAEARVVWTGDGEQRVDERTLVYILSCRHATPDCR